MKALLRRILGILRPSQPEPSPVFRSRLLHPDDFKLITKEQYQ